MVSSRFGELKRERPPFLRITFQRPLHQSSQAQIEIAIEVNLENPEMFYIISTSLRDGLMQDREDSVEFIDSK